MKQISIRLFCTAAIIFLLTIPLGAQAEKAASSSSSAGAAYNPYRVGEVLEYSVSWSRFLKAAIMKAEVRKRGIFDGLDGYHVVMKAETAGLAGALYEVSSNYESFVDADTLIPFRASNRLQQPKRVKKRNYRMDPGAGQAVLYDGRTIPIPPLTYDFASLFYTIRGMDLALDKPARFSLLENDKIQPVIAQAEGYENVETDAGSFRTVRIALKFENNGVLSDSRKLRLYLSRDSKRLPVLITVDMPVGSFRIELVSAL
ncbi:MAG: DUF3108 domain-containing protein [Acidobacteria bacterium]|nr:DUF3108 domain-containing protein [Acidobacteriota bacterium]